MHQVSWPSWIAVYLFLAGVGLAAFYTGIFASLFSNGKYRNLAKYGSYLAIPLIGIGSLMLLIDLGSPLKFWYLFTVFRPTSTMSFGAWLLTIFGILGSINALTWLSEESFAQNNSFLRFFKGKEKLRLLTGILGLPVAVLTAGYTGVLLASTSVTLWSNTPYLGLLFFVSATSTGMAALILILAIRKEDFSAIKSLARADMLVIMLEIAVFGLLLLTLNFKAPGAVKELISGSYAFLFWFGVVGCGLLTPLIVELYHMKSARQPGINNLGIPILISLSVLLGGFFLRYVLLYAGQVPL